MSNKFIRLLPEPIRWYCYLILHWLLNGSTPSDSATENQDNADTYTWIFCSTIGELNACKSLVQHYCALGKVLLLTDRAIYLESFKEQFPIAEVAVVEVDFRVTAALIGRYPPLLAIVCEIPLLLHDAPCRLSYGVLRTLRKHQVSVYMVNGWLYGYEAACKQDSIEKFLFERDYLNSFDLLSVQTQEIQQTLLAHGANPDKLVVTGNMKYDNLDTTLVLTAHTETLLESLGGQSALFVAGCVTDIWEYELVIAAFVQARNSMPELKLVIAPRHPEKPEQLGALESLLQRMGLHYDYRSQVAEESLQLRDVLIVDTFGELKAFYSVAHACYVGVNHNILEPLSFGKPVSALGNWEETYPSYPVFKIAESNGMISVVADEDGLAEFLREFVTKNYSGDDVMAQLKALSGALSQNIDLIKRLEAAR